MDGEGIEHTHATSGPLWTATKQMGPGYCHDAMDSQWNHWNWCKVVGLGSSLYFKLISTELENRQSKADFDHFMLSQGDHAVEWEHMVMAWEADHSKPDPYVVAKSGKYIFFYSLNRTDRVFAGLTEADMKLLLAIQEEELVTLGVPPLHEKWNVCVIIAGLGLKELQ